MTEQNTDDSTNHDEVDEWGEESFPASDPPSNSPRPRRETDPGTSGDGRDNVPESKKKEES